MLCWGKVVSRKFKSFFNSKNYEIGSIRSNEVRLERYKKNEKKFYLISAFGSISRLDYNNEIKEIDADGLLSTCIQHEIDHLNGKLFVDRISLLKRNIIIRKMKKLKKSEH